MDTVKSIDNTAIHGGVVLNPDGTKIGTGITLSAADIQIGSVELKDGGTDTRGTVNAANTARTTATTVLAVQHVDATGAVLPAVPVLGAGTAAIGKLAANSGVDIGDVDVTSLPALPAGTNNIGDVDVASIAAGTNLIGKVSIDQVTANANEVVVKSITAGDTNIGNVDVATIAAGDNNIGNVDIASAIPAGTNNIGDVDVLTIPGVVGTIADDATTPGAPVMIGGMAKSPDGSDPGNVSAEDDVSRLITDLNRRLYVNTQHPNYGHAHLNGSGAYTDQALIADPGDGFRVVITNIIVSTGAATALNFFLEEGASTIFGPIYLEATAGRGFASGPINLPVTASTAVTITTSAAIAQSVDVDYFIQKV